ncbi:hypothetical protein AB7W43_23655 [Providencia rettgeri]
MCSNIDEVKTFNVGGAKHFASREHKGLNISMATIRPGLRN